MMAIEASSLGGRFVQVDIGNKDRLAIQDLQMKDLPTEPSLNGLSLAACLEDKDLLLIIQIYSSDEECPPQVCIKK